jgi:hypothetical protein
MPLRSEVSATYFPYAECCDSLCQWATDYAKDAKRLAGEHARMSGHAVRTVTEKVSVYRWE